MSLDHKTFRHAGEALFGPDWQSPLARELDVSLRTVQRWARGDYDIPLGVWFEIGEHCRHRDLSGDIDELKVRQRRLIEIVALIERNES